MRSKWLDHSDPNSLNLKNKQRSLANNFGGGDENARDLGLIATGLGGPIYILVLKYYITERTPPKSVCPRPT